MAFLCFLTRKREAERTGRRRAEAEEEGLLPAALPGPAISLLDTSCLLLAGGGLLSLETFPQVVGMRESFEKGLKKEHPKVWRQDAAG